MTAYLQTRDGQKLAYDELGAGDPVMLVHGLGLSRRRWQSQVVELAEAGFRAVRFDLRGFGESQMPSGPYAMDTLIGDLSDVAAELGLRRFHLVGHSMGGMIAQRFTVDHPGSVRTLTLASTTAHNGARASLFANAMACISELGFDEAVKQPDIKAVVELVLAEAFPDDTTPLEHFRRGLEAPNMAQAYAWQATEGFSVKDELDAIACPVLVLHGTADPLIPFRLGKWIGDTIGHARFVALQGAGHSVQVERAAEFNEALLEFLSCA